MTDRVRPGCCFAPFHWNDLFGEYLSVNAVTSDAVDPISFQPEFKVCAVTLAKVATATAETTAHPAKPAAEPTPIVPTAVRSGAASVFGLESTPPPRSPSMNASTWPASWPDWNQALLAFPCCRPVRRSARSTRGG